MQQACNGPHPILPMSVRPRHPSCPSNIRSALYFWRGTLHVATYLKGCLYLAAPQAGKHTHDASTAATELSTAIWKTAAQHKFC